MDSDESSLDFATIAFKLGYLDKREMQHVKQEGDDDESQMDAALRSASINQERAQVVKKAMQPIHDIENYKIVDVLGRGGMGIVYKAIQVNLDRPVALKTILMEKVSETTIARFEREARSMAKIQHSNIVSVYDFGKKGDQFYLAMEFVDGDDAQKMVQKKNRVSEGEVWGIIRQVAAGLAHAWNSGIVHRDIKPANILLLEPPEGSAIPGNAPLAKIADFGLACQEESLNGEGRFTEERVILGSPSYMSPEQFESTNVDFRSDIYSLGATAYQLLSGVRPFTGLSITKLMAAKSNGELPLPVSEMETSEHAKKLVAKMMACEPTDRFASYAELIAEIDSVLNKYENVESQSFDESFEVLDSAESTFKPSAEATIDSSSKSIGNLDRKLVKTGRSKLMPAAILIAAVALVFLSVLVVGELIKYRPGERNLVAGKTVHLYFGESLDGWPVTPLGGKWGTETDTIGSHPIFGVNGVHSRSFKDTPFENYRIEALVWTHENAKAQFQFSISGEKNQMGVLALSRTKAEVYYQDLTDPDKRTFFTRKNVSPPQDDYMSVAIEKQEEDWFIYVNNLFVGALPVQSSDDLDEVRIAAVDGKVWFNQLTLTELVKK